ncbi:MAG TPA: hypothetical protein VG963_15355 [Polyangiaceae bacterium]|nr:hypothetical protein [Polyangiaceae bacterium]
MYHHDISSGLSCLGCISLIALCAGCGGDTVNLGGGQLGQGAPRGASCVDSPVVPSSVHAQSQQDLENLAGCEEIDGDLLVDVFAGADLSPLSSLKVIDGALSLGAGPSVYPSVPDNPDGTIDPQKQRTREQQIDQTLNDGYLGSLTGLESLERAGSLYILGIAADNLEPLLGLRRLDIDREGNNRVGSVSIEEAPHLTSLHGLSNIATIRGLVVYENPALTSLGGISISPAPQSIAVTDSPLLTSIEELAPVTDADELSFTNLGISDLSSLSNLASATSLALRNLKISQLPSFPQGSVIRSIDISNNSNLVDLSGLAQVNATSLAVAANAVLQTIPPLAQMSSLESFQAISNPLLQTIDLELPYQILPQTVPNIFGDLSAPIKLLEIENNDQLEHVSLAQGLDAGVMLDIYANRSLVSLDFGTLAHVQELDLDSNPKLTDIELGSLQAVETLSVVDNTSLDTTTLRSLKTFETTMQRNGADGTSAAP